LRLQVSFLPQFFVPSQGRSFRDKYSSFWTLLANKLVALPEESSKSRRTSGTETLRRLIDQLVSFSSMSVMNIRDAVTEAALSIGKLLQSNHFSTYPSACGHHPCICMLGGLGTGILASCKELKSQIEVAIRQMTAEDRGSLSNKKSNPKYSAYQKQKESATKVTTYTVL